MRLKKPKSGKYSRFWHSHFVKDASPFLCRFMAFFIKCRKSSLQVQLACLLTAVFSCCCIGKPQTKKCLIQSYFRQKQGSGTSGNGNLLLVHSQSNAPFAPTRLSFTGSCNDSANNTGQYSMMHDNIRPTYLENS